MGCPRGRPCDGTEWPGFGQKGFSSGPCVPGSGEETWSEAGLALWQNVGGVLATYPGVFVKKKPKGEKKGTGRQALPKPEERTA